MKDRNIRQRVFHCFSILFVLIISIGLLSCNDRKRVANENSLQNSLSQSAEFFRIIKGSSFDTLISINNWQAGAAGVEKYPLVPRDCTEILKRDKFAIPIPIKSSISMSTTYLSHLKLLECEEVVVGLSGVNFVYDSLYNERIKGGLIAEIGSDVAPDYEKILSLHPDVVLAYAVAGADNTYIQKLRTLGVRVITINDYLENNPLGKLEYIKLFAHICGKNSLADSLYNERVNEYIEIVNSIKGKISEPKKVLINLPFRDIWYVPGTKNYTSILISDAGGKILGGVEGETISSQESFEKMYTLGKEADVWIHLNSLSTISGVLNENPLYENLPVVKKGMLFNNIKRNTPKGGSDFWESGAVEPAEILKDLITIFHPDIAKESFGARPLKYYIKLSDIK